MASASSPTTGTPSLHARRIRRLVRGLPALEGRVITWIFGLEGLTLTHGEIATRLNLKPTAVREIEETALSHLRGELDTEATA